MGRVVDALRRYELLLQRQMNRLLLGVVEPYGSQRNLTNSDIKYIESLKSAKRRAEVASWRNLLREAISTSADILYHTSGAPYIVDSTDFISVSHSSTHLAVMVSTLPCAVDLESTTRNFERVASRYVTPFEAKLDPSTAPLLPLLWSAKEVLYKISPLAGLDILEDINVVAIEKGVIYGEVKGCEGRIEMLYKLQDEHIIVYTTPF